MGFWDAIFGEFIDVIEWLDETNDTLVYRFKRYKNEIKYGAKLIVRESQAAVFVNEGVVADVLGPGIYELETKNLPILSTLQHWDHGFNSPFKAEVYFCNLRRFIDLKWGTKNPIIVKDKEFGIVRIRAFGTYEIKIIDPKRVVEELVGTNDEFTVEDVTGGLRNLIISKFTTVVAKSGIPVIELAGNYEALAKFIQNELQEEFKNYGFALLGFKIENISLPPSVEKAIDERSGMEIIGDLDKYLKYSQAKSLQNSSIGSDMAAIGASIALGEEIVKNSLNISKNQEAPKPKKEYIAKPFEKLYYIAKDNKPDGPYSFDEIEDMIKEGKINNNTLVWCSGMDKWEKANNIEEIKEVLNLLVPPPLNLK